MVAVALALNFSHGSFVPSARAALVDLSEITSIALDAAASHTLALKTDGTVLAWGLNSNGQIGNGATSPQLYAIPVTGLGSGSGVTAIAVGSTHSLALKSDGTVLAWGANDVGQLGDGTTTQRTTPVQVTSATGVTAISAGIGFSLALKSDGTVLAWGTNANGQLGDGTTTQRTTPVQVTGSATGITAISAGNTFALARTSAGGVIAWGNNSATQLGDGTNSQRTAPVQVSGLSSGSGVTAIAAGNTFSLALKSDGTVLAWGNNGNGQLGDATQASKSTPVQTSGLGSGSGVTAISAGSAFALAVKSDGRMYAWGANGFGQLGDGTLVTPRLTAAQVTGIYGVSAVAAGNGLTVALTSHGAVYAWGNNSSGQVGDGTIQSEVSPGQVSGLGSGSTVSAVSGGEAFSLVLKSDGTVLSWGLNTSGQLGDGTTTRKSTPAQVSGLGSGSGVTKIAAGYTHALALKSDGTVLAWGNNASGQIGDNTTAQKNIPTQVTGSATGVSEIAASFNFSLALKSDGTVIGWGTNINGQLGDASTTQRNTPVQVAGSATGVTAISAGNNFSLALKSDGTVIAWGNNGNGQLGDGTTTQRTTPVQVTSATGITAIAAGNSFSLALKSDGTVLAWGLNSNGQLGDGTATQRTTPVQVSGLGSGSGVTAIAAANGFALARKSDGTVLAWGVNGNGQLGDGSLTDRSTPGVVSGLVSGSGITKIAGGQAHGIALKSDGAVRTWGANGSGQLGNGVEYTKNLSPAVVLVVGLQPGGSCGNVYVQVVSPNGGESHAAGDTITVFWNGFGGCGIAGYAFRLSTDSGASYPTAITPDIDGTGFMAWTAPSLEKTSGARLRIDALGSDGGVLATDTSDADFTIVATVSSTAPVSSQPAAAEPASSMPPEGTSSGAYAPSSETSSTPSIDVDKGLAAPAAGTSACTAGELIRGSQSAVYYCGSDGKRYVFPNEKTYATWYEDFSSVVTLSDAALASIPIGGNATYRPGVRMVKITTDSKTYAVARGGILRWVQSEALATALYGTDWNTKIDDVSDAYFTNYAVGAPISSAP